MPSSASSVTATLITAILFSLSHRSADAAHPPHHPGPASFRISTVLSDLGFHNLAIAAANLSTSIPTTIFAATDGSLLTCPSCSRSLLVQEHSLRGLYPLHFLSSLAFGTKIESLAPNRCLTVTSSDSNSTSTRRVFIDGVEISHPDLFNNGLLIVHALRGFITHLSPLSCNLEIMTSLSFPPRPPPTEVFLSRRLLLKDAMAKLRAAGYTMVALAMRVRYSELAELDSMTLFAVDDESIFLAGGGDGGGRSYLAEVGLHIVPNMLLREADLSALERGAVLPTMKVGRMLMVTSAARGDKAAVAAMRINFVKVKRFDVVYNGRIVVHGLPVPFHALTHFGGNSTST